MEREERKKIFLETVDIVNNGDYITDKGKLVKIPLSHKNGDLTLEDTTLYDNIANVYVKDMKKYDDFKVEVTNEEEQTCLKVYLGSINHWQRRFQSHRPINIIHLI